MDNFDNDFNNYNRQPNHEYNARERRGSHHNLNRKVDQDTEFATDFMSNEVTDGNSTSGALIAGVAGVVASVIALFAYSFILGAIGIGLGLFAVAKGNKVIGYVTMGIGILAVGASLFSNAPFMSIFY